MSFLDELQNDMPDRNRLLYLLALTMIGAALLGDLALVGVSVLPHWRRWQEMNTQLQQVRAEMERVQYREDPRTPEDFAAEIAVAEGNLAERGAIFLGEAQANETLNQLYRHAEESAVRILSLESQSVPAPPAAGEGETEAGPAIYDVLRFRLVARGAMVDLLAFVGRLEMVRHPGVVISDVAIASDAGGARLEMDVWMAVSGYSAPEGDIAPSDDAEAGGAAGRPDADVGDMQEALLEAWGNQDWQQVIDLLTILLETDPDNVAAQAQLLMAHVSYGEQLLEAGTPDAAKRQFELALEISPESPAARRGLAAAETSLPPTDQSREGILARLEAAREADDTTQAVELLLLLRSLEPAEVAWVDQLYAAYLDHGAARLEAGDLTAAKEAFGAALALRPESEAALDGLERLAELSGAP